MSAIQGAANNWVDATARYPAGSYRSVGTGDQGVWGTTGSTSFTSVVSDVEEEGEVEETPHETHASQVTADDITIEIEAGMDEFSASDETVAAVAAEIGIVEAAMRQHSAGEAGCLDDHEADDGEVPTGESFAESITGDLQQNPASAFSATSPSNDRLGILSLLA